MLIKKSTELTACDNRFAKQNGTHAKDAKVIKIKDSSTRGVSKDMYTLRTL